MSDVPNAKYIYFIANGRGLVKIGCSRRPDRRLEGLRTGSGCALELLGSIPGTFADEKLWHSRFAAKRVDREWFELDSELRHHITSACDTAPLFNYRPETEQPRIRRRPIRSNRETLKGISDRVQAFLKQRHPHKTAECVAHATGISITTIRGSFERKTAFGSPNMMRLTEAYGLDFLRAVCSEECEIEWVTEAHEASKRTALESQLAGLQARLERL